MREIRGGDCSVSWALAGLHLMSSPDDHNQHQQVILLGCAHLLGLLIEKSRRKQDLLEEKARRAEDELREMKAVRAEDAKANEKVVGIFASHEQSWIAERKNLRLQIQALASQLKSLTAKNEEIVCSLNYQITEAECALRIKEEELDEEARMRNQLQEKLELLDKRVEELRKQEAMFAELEAEMARVIEHGEIEKREMNELIERKEEAVIMAKNLSDEVVRMQNDSEQKDRILSALLRKSKMDADEKGMLLKEVKMAKAKKKQAELEMEKWRSKWESRHNKKGSRLLSSSSSYSLEAGSSQEKKEELQKTLLLDYFESEGKGDKGVSEIKRIDHRLSSDEMGDDQLGVSHGIQNLRDWMRLETEKYVTILEQKHFTEVEAFTEQMRLKEEKLEAFRWRLLSMDIESKRLQSHIEGLEDNLSILREENMRLKVFLADKEGEIKSLKEQISSFVHHRCQAEENEHLGKLSIDDQEENSIIAISEQSFEESESLDEQVIESPNQEIEEEKEVTVGPISPPVLSRNSEKEGEELRKVEPVKQSWRMDIHALGVSYKIKRLKQQLVMLEKLAGMKQTMVNDDTINSPNDSKADDNKQHLKGFTLVIHLLNKQLKRFQSLEDKTDDLCKRMHENSREGNRRDSNNASKERSKKLELFLEETFQLQRYMVATGQKMMDIQSKISSSFGSSEVLDESAGFNMEQFADVIRTLFKEIQRGLEVRIARIIGDLEGTLAFDGIQRM